MIKDTILQRIDDEHEYTAKEITEQGLFFTSCYRTVRRYIHRDAAGENLLQTTRVGRRFYIKGENIRKFIQAVTIISK